MLPGKTTLGALIAKFGVVGAVAFVVDVSVFNLLLYAGSSGEGVLFHKPVTAKIIAVLVATTCAYIGNRVWTFKERPPAHSTGKQYLLFLASNGIALLITVGCLAFSRYVLQLNTPLSNNLSANVVGLLLGTLFRFWSYYTWVFPKGRE